MAVDLRQFFGALRARWRFATAMSMIGIALTGCLLVTAPAIYKSSATIFISTPPSGVTNTAVTSILTQERARSYAFLATDSQVLERSVSRLGGGMTAHDLRDALSSRVVESTLLVVIEAKAKSPARAEQIASVVAEETLDLIGQVEGQKVAGVELPIVASLAEKPRRATVPAEPDLVQGWTIGVVLSLLTGFTATALRIALDLAVRSAADVRAVAGSSPLALVPTATGRRTARSPDDEPAGPIVEAINLLRTNLQFAHLDHRMRTILVTSAASGEGKTFVAENLATAMARVGQSVALVDANLRAPVLSASGARKADVGLVSVLTEVATLQDALEVSSAGVHVLAAGPVPPNPVEVLDSSAIRGLLAQLSHRFDVVIVDTSALLEFADAAGLLAAVDGALLVTPYGGRRDRLLQAVTRIGQAGGRLAGVVMNGVPVGATLTYEEPADRASATPKGKRRRARR